MKHLSRIFTLIVTLVFVFGAVNAQNTLMTKAQALGLKSSSTVQQAATVSPKQSASRTIFIEEGFDTDFLPTGWTQDILNVDNTWIQTNPETGNFNTIDPTSLFSAMVPWVAADQDEWLYTPEIDPAGEEPLTINFYAGVSGPWIEFATLKCHISNDGGSTWTELWNAADEIAPDADWAWNYVSLDISGYSSAPFMVAWQYVGNDGDLAGIDGVEIKAGYEYLFFDDMEGYTAGTKLAEQADPDWWTTWSDAPGGAEDGMVSTDQAHSPVNSVMISGTNDQVLKLGNKTSGEYIFSVWYYIPSGFGGYINMQHFELPGTEWAYEAYFGAATGSENGYIFAGDPAQIPFTFAHDTWMKLETWIDLDEDLAYFMIDDQIIAEWQWSLQAQGDPGAKQIGGVNLYAGAPGTDVAKYYFDDVSYIVLDPGVTNPIINIATNPITSVLEEGASTTIVRPMSNTGQSDLNYEIFPSYNIGTKSLGIEPTGIHSAKVRASEFIADPDYTPTNTNPSNRDVVLHYDNDNSSAIGRDSDYEYRVSAMFPVAMVQPYIGMTITSVEVYINDPVTAAKIQIYDMGSMITPGPGDLLLEQSFNGVAQSWNTVTLDTPIAITGKDIWVGWWMAAAGGTFAPGCDAGPANPNGDWISTGPGWSHLGDNPDLNYNWNIRANLTGDPIIQWLSADPANGVLAQDNSVDVNINLDATGLASDVYQGKVNIRSNDPTNEMVSITVGLAVTVGINEQGEKEYVVVYPNPANDMLNVGSNGEVTQVRLINTVGQVVFDNIATQIDVSNMESGVYFIQIATKNGTTTQKIIIQ
ncbi:MAG: T9SS type A sorting domain-containing protein [Bacteroidales bacterium]|nr:T9SS type A sorting domain-containing protein [Bacteroidales bacterium]